MRRLALLCCVFTTSTLLAGCTGMGVFLDHTHNTWFGQNPNAPAGNSEMFMRLRGEPLAITPLQPENGNVWPGPQKPDPTLQELEQQQNGGSAAPAVGGGVVGHQQPRPAGNPDDQPNGATPVVRPRGSAPAAQSQNGTTVDTTGGTNLPGYRGLQPPANSGKGILVPNGNGTSTLISPDGSVTTVPSKP